MEDRYGVQPVAPTGTTITRFNYHRPKWFGGFFGFSYRHNQPGNCTYDADAVGRIITPENLNTVIEPLYLKTPILAYHMAITIFLALSVLLTLLQQGLYWLIEFAFLDLNPGNGYLHTLGILWYCLWIIGLFTIIPLYYVSIWHVEVFFREGDPSFEEYRVKFNVKKDPPGKFVLIPGFKRIDALEIVSA